MPSFPELLTQLAAEHERLASAIRGLTSENERLQSRLNDYLSTTLNRPDEPEAFLEQSCETPLLSAPLVLTADGPSCAGKLRASTLNMSFSDINEVPEYKTAVAVCTQKRNTVLNATEYFRPSMRRVSVKSPVASADMRFPRISPLVINPEHNRIYVYWDFISVVALAYVALVVPFQVGLLSVSWDAMFFMNSVVDLFFFADMVLQFFVMFPKRTDFGVVYECRHGPIIRKYISSWFFIDLFSVIPFDFIGLLSESSDLSKIKVIKVIRLLRLIKLVRVCKATKALRRLEVVTSITYQKMALLQFFALLAMISHWLACCWALTLSFSGDDGVPRWIDSLTALESDVAVMTKDSPVKLYVAALYFTSYTITSVGYGDIGPQNDLERIVCTVMIYVCGISWAYVLGQVCGIVGNLDADEQTFRKSMDDLNIMMHERNFHVSLRKRLRAFFLSTREIQRHGRHQLLLTSMSPALQGEVAIELNRIWFSTIPFLRDVVLGEKENVQHVPPYLVKIAISLESSVHAQSEVFGKANTFCVLAKGLACRKMRLFRVGDSWGEDFLLSDSLLIEHDLCFAFTYLELSTMSGEAFIKILKEHNEDSPELERRVRRFVVRLAVRRGMLLEAKKRRKQYVDYGHCWVGPPSTVIRVENEHDSLE
eukprot:TRINITY_DN8905_c0_g2_i1.p1 TRINITY_DN8905_c0_g2~~TRINITY_DN8905_c0_g2_i1.p1  ORF type:complete len:653 (-),score=96.70 TRINITY_DN8905_c0_g2_i1:138-2096(-)